MSNKTEVVETFIEGLSSPRKELVAQIRDAVLASNDAITEQIKWKAPSFCIDGDDRVTLNLSGKDGVRLVFHRGVKVKDDAFVFDDSSGLLEWAAPDRGVMRFTDTDDFAAKQDALVQLVNRWIEATS